MDGKRNNLFKNGLTERWKVEDKTDDYWEREICARIYVRYLLIVRTE